MNDVVHGPCLVDLTDSQKLVLLVSSITVDSSNSIGDVAKWLASQNCFFGTRPWLVRSLEASTFQGTQLKHSRGATTGKPWKTHCWLFKLGVARCCQTSKASPEIAKLPGSNVNLLKASLQRHLEDHSTYIITGE